MPKLFVIFRTDNVIFDCVLYSQELSPVEFDEGDRVVKLLFLADKFNSNIHCETLALYDNHSEQQVFVQSQTSTVIQKCAKAQRIFGNPQISCPSQLHEHIISKFNGASQQEPAGDSQTEKDDEFVYSRTLALCVVPWRKCVVLMDAHLVSCVATEVHRSRRFRRRFLKYLSRMFGFRTCNYNDVDFTSICCDNFLSIPFMVDVVSIWSKQKIDYPWDIRISGLLTKRMLLEEAMAWLSTLGGGYSALGDYDVSHAVTAGEVSLKQMKIAIELDDPVMAARCRLFWAQSRMQLGFLGECKKIVWMQYLCIKRTNLSDWRLLNMCLAIWSRLQYMYHLHRQRCHKDSKDKLR